MPNETLAARCGLSAAVAALHGVFAKHAEIERVVLYGSRAEGTRHKGSDIDLTLLGEKLSY